MDSSEPKTDLNDRSSEDVHESEGPHLYEDNTETTKDNEYSSPAEPSDSFVSSRDSVPNEVKVTPAAEASTKKSPLAGLRTRLSSLHLPEGGGGKVAQWLRRYWYIVLAVLVIVIGLIVWQAYTTHVNAQWAKATDYYGRADYNDAAKAIKGLPVPTDAQRLTVYSQTMLATRQLDKALNGYSALYNQKKDPSVKLIIGNIYNEQKKYDDAAKAYSELIAANSGYVQAYVNLATLYKLQGKSDDAVSTAKQAVKANPNSATLYELLISMLLDKPDSADYQQAVASLKKLNPQDPIFESIQQ